VVFLHLFFVPSHSKTKAITETDMISTKNDENPLLIEIWEILVGSCQQGTTVAVKSLSLLSFHWQRGARENDK
jgi:hypothetical protein